MELAVEAISLISIIWNSSSIGQTKFCVKVTQGEKQGFSSPAARAVVVVGGREQDINLQSKLSRIH